ncbi:MAG TPA: helix-turn-helix domain-containing protein, partial [Sphingomonas sp.]|nr:helix-turn-helix domain-containing protein [Sphingomonas sp.]
MGLREPLAQIAAECSLPRALEAMGERWSFLILRAAFNGLKHFEEIQSNLGIARNILANRLGRLVDAGILTREPCPEDRRKIEYRLTEKGLDLLPTMIALRQWGEKWETCTPSNPVLVDKR